MIDFFLSALGALAGVLVVLSIGLLPHAIREQKKINNIFRIFKKDRTDD